MEGSGGQGVEVPWGRLHVGRGVMIRLLDKRDEVQVRVSIRFCGVFCG